MNSLSIGTSFLFPPISTLTNQICYKTALSLHLPCVVSNFLILLSNPGTWLCYPFPLFWTPRGFLFHLCGISYHVYIRSSYLWGLFPTYAANIMIPNPLVGIPKISTFGRAPQVIDDQMGN